MNFDVYQNEGFYDELLGADGKPRPEAELMIRRIEELPAGSLASRQKAAEAAMFQLGITFSVYGAEEDTERIIPFDLIPRVISAAEWDLIERGLKQRITALNLFVDDIYHAQKILKDGLIPAELIRSAASFRASRVGLNPPRGIWCHITGTDLVRDGDGRLYVLEDNLRCPSGVSYVLENRRILKRIFPSVFAAMRVRPVDDYPDSLLRMLQHLAPAATNDPTVVVLTPGFSIPPISNTLFWRSKWASSSLRDPTSPSPMAMFTCAPRAA